MPASRPQPGDHPEFRRGDHLRVRRPMGYSHHGIYVSDDRVIQFGGGIRDKSGATIDAVSLAEFRDGGEARVVVHDGRPTAIGQSPLPDSPDRIVERAEWLLANHPPRGRYNLIGNNCEHMANFCVNEYTESPQVRRFLLLKGYFWGVVGLYLAWSSRSARRVPTAPILTATFVGFLVTATYHRHIRRFWRDVGKRWLADDRTTRAEPRSEHPGRE